MTMFDEELLINSLRDVAEAFEISDGAADDVLMHARATPSASSSTHVKDFARKPSHRRTMLAAAAAVLVVGGIALPLVRHGGPSATSAFEKIGLGGRPALSGTGFLSVRQGSASHSPYYAPTSPTGSVANSPSTGVAPRIASSGSIDLRVRGGHVEPTFAKLTALVSGEGGSVASSDARIGSRTTGNFAYGVIVLQVPQRSFATLVTQVQRFGRVTSVHTSSTVVTAQYVDLRARISAEEASRHQYLAIMSRAGTIGDILAVQRQVDSIQSQIEQLQGQLNVLDHQTAFGTLTVNLTTSSTTPVVHGRSGLTKAWHDAVGGFIAGVEGLIRVSGPVLFAVLCLGALLTLGRLARRATRRRRM